MKRKTNMQINRILPEARHWIKETIKKAEYLSSEFEIVELCIYGSRKNGIETDQSDLDILLEYSGAAREDDIFNALHREVFKIEDIVIDINPINANNSGTIEEYLARCDDMWKSDN